MTERPILFSGPMVIAILGGYKTMTRRVMKMPAGFTECDRDVIYEPSVGSCPFVHTYNANGEAQCVSCYHGAIGDQLWVRETWHQHYVGEILGGRACYRADNPPCCLAWKPSIFMPRWASRITLEIVGVRVERLQEITDDDAFAEGVLPNWAGPRAGYTTAKPAPSGAAFADLWEHINAKRGYGWDTNCWVWAISFKRVKP